MFDLAFEPQMWHFILLFITAFFSGFVDSIAGGGGLISIPMLLAVGVPPHAALATNKLQGTFGCFTAALRFALKGMVNFKSIYIGIIFTFIGACVGTFSVLLVDPDVLKFLVPFFLVAVFIYTILHPKLGDEITVEKINSNLFYITFGFAIGFYDGFLGPGTGSFWTFAMIALLGISMKTSVAHTKVLNFVSNFVSLIVFIIGGQILWALGLVMAVGQILGAYLGSHLVITKEVKFIRTMFLFVVALTICKLIYDLIF